MKTIAILILDQTLPSGVAGITDIFKLAGAHRDLKKGFRLKTLFDVKIVSTDGKPVRLLNSFIVEPHGPVESVSNPDLIIVPSSGYVPSKLGNYPENIKAWLRFHHSKKRDIASGCTGAFVLAEAGILDHRLATTHWGYAAYFRKKYPLVRLRSDMMITEDKNLFCSGGGSAGIDLVLHLIERYNGMETANYCAKLLLLERNRTTQMPFSVFHEKKNHQDAQMAKAQETIERRYGENLSIDALSDDVGMSLRNFKRRFKNATGDPPLVYIQKFRVEMARKLLETGNLSIEEISGKVSYDDVGFFRRLFHRHTGISPTEYRRKFNSRFFREGGEEN